MYQKQNKKKQASFLLLTLGLMLLYACGGNVSNQQYTEGFGTISGALILPNGKIAKNTKVEIVNLPHLQTKTDEKGLFELRLVPSGRRAILFTHPQNFGLRAEIWIIRNRKLELDTSSNRLKPTSVVAGRVQSLHRFGSKGIKVSIKGTQNSTFTTNSKGEYRLKKVAQGCHTLLFETPFFASKEKQICIKPKQTFLFSSSIELKPSQTCSKGKNSCPKNGLCNHGFCIPAQGGESKKLLQETKTLPSTYIAQKQIYKINVLKNVGQGKLKIQALRLQSPTQAFQLLQTFPHTLEKQKTLQLSLQFQSNQPGQHEASLELQTNDPEKPNVTVRFIVQVKPYTENCLQSKPKFFALGQQQIGTPLSLEIELFNRCADSILLKQLRTDFPQPTLFTALQKEQQILETGQKKIFKYQLVAQAYGQYQGSLQLAYNQKNEQVLQFPLSMEIANNKLSLTKKLLNFGAVALGRTKTIRLGIKSKANFQSLQQIQYSFHKAEHSRFKINGPLQSQKGIYYLPIQYTAPNHKGLESAWLELKNLPHQQNSSLFIKLQGESKNLH